MLRKWTLVLGIIFALPAAGYCEEEASPKDAYVIMTVQVEIRGILKYSARDRAEIITRGIDDLMFVVKGGKERETWVLSLGHDEELVKAAKLLNGKQVVVKGQFEPLFDLSFTGKFHERGWRVTPEVQVVRLLKVSTLNAAKK